MYIFVGLPSPPGEAPKPADGEGLQRSQTLGQRIMGNVMENIFLRNLTSKSKSQTSDASQPSSPMKVLSHMLALYNIYLRIMMWMHISVIF